LEIAGRLPAGHFLINNQQFPISNFWEPIMHSLRCPSCSLLQFSNAAVCKRCGQPLAAPPPNQQAYTESDYQTPYGGGYAAPGYPPNYAHYGYRPQPMLNDGPAKTAMIFGILGLAVCGLLAPIGLVLGVKARRRIKDFPQQFGGDGMALAGLVMGGIGTASMFLVIPLIAAIAIPNLLAARRTANEGAAISALRTIHGAEATCRANTEAGQFCSLKRLADLRLIDRQLASGAKSGYRFEITVLPGDRYAPSGFQATAVPVVTNGTGQTGGRSFFVDETGLIRYSNRPSEPPTAFDPALE
jgi:hypothetical protein